jgi:enoyl-CoA hydratase
VNDAVEADQLMDKAMQMALQIAENAPFSIKMIKKGLRMAQGEASLEAIMDFEVEGCLACVSTKERQESLKEFADRKK